MDPVTHGIAGALIGKGFFSKRQSRVAIFAATLGAVFPDVDVFCDAFSHDPLAIARYHRGFTHSFVGLPIFAFALAALTRWYFLWYAERRGKENWQPPSFGMLFLIYAVGIASHIILDGFTSFGTRMLNPFSKDRVAWDVLFIIDFTFTALILLPQVAAWIYKSREGWQGRAAKMWGFFAVMALAVWALARSAAFPFSSWAVVIAVAIFAALFFLPGRNNWGSRIGRASWCRGGFYVACAYVLACGVAHHVALDRVRGFAASRHVEAEKIGALPMPPSLLDWNGLILTSTGVYQSDFSLNDSAAPDFRLVADSAPNRFTEEAGDLESVRTFLWFARFPVMHFRASDGQSLVSYGDLRFYQPGDPDSMSFTFGVTFDAQGKVLHVGWIRRGARVPHKDEGGEPAGKTE